MLGFMEPLRADEIRVAVKSALAEDVGTGDVTTLATIPPEMMASAVMRAREPLIFAGLAFAVTAFQELSERVQCTPAVQDGGRAGAGDTLLMITGPARALLTAERVALNYVQRLSGVATLTHAFVEAVKGTPAQILDTRKTTPGWRRFEKYAVTCGGGTHYRMGLYDMILIKDNHLAALKQCGPKAIKAAIEAARTQFPGLKIEVETDTLDQVEEALEAGAELILLDNMNPVQLRLAVQRCRGRAKTEASGGVTLGTVAAIAQSGVDFISVGALTHSARGVDIGLDFELDAHNPRP